MTDITAFCAEEDGRYPMTKPWIQDGWLYATDACIAVRVPSKEPDTAPGPYPFHPMDFRRQFKPTVTDQELPAFNGKTKYAPCDEE